MCLSYLSVHPTSPQESLEGIWHKHPLGLKDADTGHQIKKKLTSHVFCPLIWRTYGGKHLSSCLKTQDLSLGLLI